MAIVIDNGSAYMKVGKAGGEEPDCVFPTAVAGDIVGAEALAKGENNVTFPLKAGEIKDINAMEKVWKYALDKVGGIQNRPVLLTEPILNDNENREKMCKVMFENLGVPAIYIAPQPVLALYATGRKTGLVLEIGEQQTQIATMVDGYAVKDGLAKSSISAGKMTGLMRDRLGLDSNAEAQRAKEQLCYLTADPETELKKDEASLEKSFKLKDGTEVKLGAERIKVPEMILFNEGGLGKLVQESVQKCEMDNRRDLAANIILSGETCNLEGLKERLNAATPDHYKVVGAKGVHQKTWIGGSILASLDFFRGAVVSKAEWDAEGMDAVLKKLP